MFRPMRRIRQLMTTQDCIDMLNRNSSGVLAVTGDDDYPYAVPLNDYYEDNKLYFHGAKTGHKIDAIINHPKVSFCVIDMEQNVPEEFTSYFRSVIAFGKATLVTDDNEKRMAVEKMAIKYSPDESKEHRDSAIEREWTPLAVIRVDIEHMTGKQAIELVK